MGTSSLKTRVGCIRIIGGSSNRGIVADALTKLNIVGNHIVGHMLNLLLAEPAFKQPFMSPRQYSVLSSYLIPELSVLELVCICTSNLRTILVTLFEPSGFATSNTRLATCGLAIESSMK